jgi:hypothetical protein
MFIGTSIASLSVSQHLTKWTARLMGGVSHSSGTSLLVLTGLRLDILTNKLILIVKLCSSCINCMMSMGCMADWTSTFSWPLSRQCELRQV